MLFLLTHSGMLVNVYINELGNYSSLPADRQAIISSNVSLISVWPDLRAVWTEVQTIR